MAIDSRKCIRCRQALPEGSGYCVACGCSNEDALTARQVQVTNAAENRIGFARLLSGIFRAIGGIFRRI